jgi:hypothetical protein
MANHNIATHLAELSKRRNMLLYTEISSSDTTPDSEPYDLKLLNLERAEVLDANRYFLAMAANLSKKFKTPRLPPLGTGQWLRDDIFATYG